MEVTKSYSYIVYTQLTGCYMEEKKAKTKNQHYVPQFYQRFFSSDGKVTGAYVLEHKKIVAAAPIKNQASGDYFYSPNMKIEEALTSLEGLASTAINKLIVNPKEKLADEDAMALYVFAMIQFGRTKAFADKMANHADVSGTTMLKQYVQAMRKTAKASEVKDITDEILEGVSIKLDEPGLHSLGIISQMMDVLADLQPYAKILINKTKKPFVTSDNPACLYDQHFERIGGLDYAMGSCGIQLYLPLTPNMAILYYDSECYKVGEKKKRYVEISQESDVMELNKLVACYADKVLLFKQGCGNANLDDLGRAHDRFRVTNDMVPFKVSGTDNRVIFGFHHISMYCKLKLSFVKELTNYKARNIKSYPQIRDRIRLAVQILDGYAKKH